MATYEELFENIKIELQKRPQVYDSLVAFVQKKYSYKVKEWCAKSEDKIGKGMENDLLDTLIVAFCEKTEIYFFCHDGQPFDTSKTLIEFHAWTKKVAKNEYLDFVEDNEFWGKIDPNNPLGFSVNPDGDEDEGTFHDPGDTDDGFARLEGRDEASHTLGAAMRAVFDLRTEPHMVLSWLAVSVAIYMGKFQRHETGRVVEHFFSEKTLYEMFDYIVPNLKQVAWFEFTPEELQEQRARLDVVNEETGKLIGEMRFCEFYQSKGGRASISEWFTRTSEQITRRLARKNKLF